MVSVLKKIGKVFLIILIMIALVLIAFTVYHHTMLSQEAPLIKQIGTKVRVDGNYMNIYTVGEKQNENDSTIVLLSGSGISSPIYDYKVLYSKLEKNYKVSVIEKFGYGYSDVSKLPRDIETLVKEDRDALAQAGITAPYVLMPHSMSALESIYWANEYPDEVSGIIGLDMAVPSSYTKENDNINHVTLLKYSVFLGFHRIPFFNPVSKLDLTDEEIEQHKLLTYRNSLNDDVYNECKEAYNNAQKVKKLGVPAVPMLMFTTDRNGDKLSEEWVKAQDDFAGQSDNCKQIHYHCGHNLYYYKSDDISKEITTFMDNINK